uniref:Uncharacterized protein n=1 Tax=viral metagenome TaxID=1070528 RepID=A0A6C0J5W8_9ZZZZ
MTNNISISGTIGYVLFKYNNIYVLVFSDVHDGVSYCKEGSIQMADYFKSRLGKNNVLLEESTQKEVKLKDLWPNSKHTQELKKLAYSNNNIMSFDIRPLLVPFSWELLDIDPNLGKVTLSDYLSLIDTFFNGTSLLFTKYIKNKLNKISCNNKKLEKKNHLQLEEIKRQYNLFKHNNSKLMTLSLNNIKKNNENILEKINDIISYIMEWYIILLILNSEKNIIVHTGLAHSSKLIRILYWYKFHPIESDGLNFLDQISNIEQVDTIQACIQLPSRIDNFFKTKQYGFFSNGK